MAVVILDIITSDLNGNKVYTPLPAPESITCQDEIIWSADTGRAQNANMIGTVIAEKKTFKINWGILLASQKAQIKSGLCAGFQKVRIRDDGKNYELTIYRGTLTSEYIGYLRDGYEYYRSASVSIIQQ